MYFYFKFKHTNIAREIKKEKLFLGSDPKNSRNQKRRAVFGKCPQKLQKIWKDDVSMENKQKINCTVGSCKFNEQKDHECTLKQIVVTPKENVNTAYPDESMCSSYENK